MYKTKGKFINGRKESTVGWRILTGATDSNSSWVSKAPQSVCLRQPKNEHRYKTFTENRRSKISSVPTDKHFTLMESANLWTCCYLNCFFTFWQYKKSTKTALNYEAGVTERSQEDTQVRSEKQVFSSTQNDRGLMTNIRRRFNPSVTWIHHWMVGTPRRRVGAMCCNSSITGFYARSLRCRPPLSHPASYCFLTRFAWRPIDFKAVGSVNGRKNRSKTKKWHRVDYLLLTRLYRPWTWDMIDRDTVSRNSRCESLP
jgi:hypothetical protein